MALYEESAIIAFPFDVGIKGLGPIAFLSSDPVYQSEILDAPRILSSILTATMTFHGSNDWGYNATFQPGFTPLGMYSIHWLDPLLLTLFDLHRPC